MTPEDAEKYRAMGLPIPPGDPAKVRVVSRVTLRKFEGDDQSGEPTETIVLEDDDFVAVTERKNHATD